MKRIAISYWEMQIKTTVWYHYPDNMLKISVVTTLNADKGEEKLDHSYFAEGM